MYNSRKISTKRLIFVKSINKLDLILVKLSNIRKIIGNFKFKHHEIYNATLNRNISKKIFPKLVKNHLFYIINANLDYTSFVD